MDTNTFNTTALQDELTGALVGLARAADYRSRGKRCDLAGDDRSLGGEQPGCRLQRAEVLSLIDRCMRKSSRLCPIVPSAPLPCGRTADYNMANIWNAPEDIPA